VLEAAETAVRIAGAVTFAVAWLAGALGAARAVQRKTARAVGLAGRIGAPAAYALVAGPYLLVCALLWHPFAEQLSSPARAVLLVVGSIVGFTGAAAYLWGRHALGEMYDVSSALGSELFTEHRLVTSGPYAIVRHPMYVGLMLSATGGLAVYRTWTFVFVVACLPGAVFKASREDRLLAEEFGEAFEAYCRAVPGWVPRRLTSRRRA
jgi:protein-S-isoprenylcysteine O-methyltransferase Ste14